MVKKMKIKQWSLLASHAKPSGSASRAWTSLRNQRISTWAPQWRSKRPFSAQRAHDLQSQHPGLFTGAAQHPAGAQGEQNWATGTQRNKNWVLGSAAEKSRTVPCVISHGLPSLFKGNRKKAQPSGVLLWVSKWSILFQLCCFAFLLSLVGFVP